MKRTIISTAFFLPNFIFRLITWPIKYMFSSAVPLENIDTSQEKKLNYNEFFNSEAPLLEKFEKACEILKTVSTLTTDQQLRFYGKKTLSFCINFIVFSGLFKQAKEGDCLKSKPSSLDIVNAQKWYKNKDFY